MAKTPPPRDKDVAAQKIRAKQLRAQIMELAAGAPPAPSDTTKPESPRHFVQRRMAELSGPPKKKRK